MRLLHVRVDGIEPFEDKVLDLSFFAQDQVRDAGATSGVTRLGAGDSTAYSQNVLAIAGINATGKTTALRVLQFVIDALIGDIGLYRGNRSRNLSAFASEVAIDVLFEEGGKFFLLESRLCRAQNSDMADEEDPREDTSFIFGAESLWQFRESFPRKKELASFERFREGSHLLKVRMPVSQSFQHPDLDPEQFMSDDSFVFLSPYTSIVVPFAVDASAGEGAKNQEIKHRLRQLAALVPADRFAVPIGSIPDPVLHAFDDSIEYFRFDSGRKIHVRLKDSFEEQEMDRNDAVRLLSSGTRRGSFIISLATRVLRTGGYLLIDEIENSINKELVRMILGLFVNRSTNPLGATLVFTTHYAELLDLVGRKDNIYFFRRSADSGNRVAMSRYSDYVRRGELKRSEVFLANFLRGTAPKARELKILRQYVAEQVSMGAHGDS